MLLLFHPEETFDPIALLHILFPLIKILFIVIQNHFVSHQNVLRYGFVRVNFANGGIMGPFGVHANAALRFNALNLSKTRVVLLITYH